MIPAVLTWKLACCTLLLVTCSTANQPPVSAAQQYPGGQMHLQSPGVRGTPYYPSRAGAHRRAGVSSFGWAPNSQLHRYLRFRRHPIPRQRQTYDSRYYPSSPLQNILEKVNDFLLPAANHSFIYLPDTIEAITGFKTIAGLIKLLS